MGRAARGPKTGPGRDSVRFIEEDAVRADIERREVTFVGRVQGVGFRATTRTIAQGFEVSGWVRNEPDGSVRMEAQGAGAELDLFVQAIQARVGHLIAGVTTHALPTRDETGFAIRH